MKLFITNFILIVTILTSDAQTFNYTHYTVDDGLASSNIYLAYQDSKKFMWLASESGVNRFDGKTFDLFTTEDGLADNDVLKVFEDSFGRIWFLSISGRLSYYFDGEIHNEKTDPYLKNCYNGSGFFYAFEDSKKRIWFCSYNACVSMLDKTEFIKVCLPKTSPDVGISGSEDNVGKIIFYSERKKYLFDEKSKSLIEFGTFPLVINASFIKASNGFTYYHSDVAIYRFKKDVFELCLKLDDFKKNKLITAIGDSQNNIILSTINGAFFIESGLGTKRKVREYLKDKWINTTTIDSEENLWICARGDGVYFLPKQYRENKVFNSTSSSLLNDNIHSLEIDKAGIIWIGSSNGQFSCLKNDSIYNLDLPGSIKIKGNILSIQKDKKGNIWGCTDNHLYKIIQSKNADKSDVKIIADPYNQRTLDICINSKNELYIVCPQWLASVSDVNNNLTLKPIEDTAIFKRTFCAFYDNTDKLFVSNIDGLYERVGEDYINLSKGNPVLINVKVVDIDQTADSTILLSTDGYGLFFLKDGKIIKQMTQENGIASGICRRIKVFGDKIFVCTNKGLTEFTYKNKVAADFINFNKSNGLPADDIRDVVVTPDYFYAGTSKGLTVLKSNSRNFSESPPPVYIRSVMNNSKNINWEIPFVLEFGNHDLTVNFNAITYSNPKDVKYEYSFSKDSVEWKSVSSTELNFPDISPGNYVFSVRAGKMAGLWSEPQSFSFSVKPPFYRTWWFESFAAIIIFGGLALAVISYNRRKMRAELIVLEKRNALNLERNRISADMHDDLGGDLTRISVIAELLKIQRKSGDDMQVNLNKISAFVKGARGKMDDIVWALNPTNDTVGNLIGYINRYCLNFFEGSGIIVETKSDIVNADLQLNARQRRNIFLVLKEIANNSIKHSSASNFYIFFTADEIEFRIKAGDNGKGIKEDEQRPFSSGLKNINKRIFELNGTVSVVSENNTGTNYEISFPINAKL